MIFDWVIKSYIEILGVLTGLIYLYFSVKQIIWLWPFGILTSLLYMYVFYNAGFYADMSLQIYYFFISIYGWFHWLKGNKDSSRGLKVSSISKKEWLIYILITILLTIIFGVILSHLHGSNLPYWDAFTTSASVIATWMLARKIIENWLWWVVIDIVSLGMYLYKGLYPTLLLFAFYTTMAIIGYLQWKKDLKTE
jgi:nicotinamide mononucleotide transporter